MHLKTLAVSIGLACIAQDVGGQRPSSTVSIVAGTRVRVKTATLVAPLVANFLEQRGDTLVFIEDGTGRGVWSFGLAQIERLERTAGESGRNTRPTAKAALIGGGIGLVAGLAFASVASPSDSTREYSRPLTAAAGAAIGAGIGAIIGSRTKSERWINVPLPRQLTLVPNRRGGFTLTVGFR